MVTIALSLDRKDAAALRFALGARNNIGADPHVVDQLADLASRVPQDADFVELTQGAGGTDVPASPDVETAVADHAKAVADAVGLTAPEAP